MSNLPIPKYHLIGHRGAAGIRPENTLCSFTEAAELGLDWIEFDVQLSRDDRWIVMHDDTIDRTTNGRGLVKDLTIYDLKELEAGLWFKPPFLNEKVPTLKDTLELAQKFNLFCDVEIKGSEMEPKKYADLFAAFVTAHADICQNILVTSFNLDCLILLRSLQPDLQIGLNIDYFDVGTIAICQKYKFANINCNADKFTKADLDAAKQAKIPVFLFTVNDQTSARYWLENGVQGIFTDRPDLLLPV